MKYPLAVMLMLAACSRAFDYAGPAPPGALECVLAHSRRAGYELIEGTPGEGWVRLRQPVPPPPAEALPPAPGTVMNRPGRLAEPIANSLFVRVESGQLLVTILGITEGGDEVAAGRDADSHARTILTLCTADPPIMPGQDTIRPR